MTPRLLAVAALALACIAQVSTVHAADAARRGEAAKAAAEAIKAAAEAEGRRREWLVEGGERERALTLKPNVEHGREVFEVCATCHSPEGWGRADGAVPGVAGQHRTVLIKQLTDIREGNRDNPAMYPFALTSEIGGEQSVADVTEYISRLPMSPDNGVGPGQDLDLGRTLYAENCARCHGAKGEGNRDRYAPRIQGQHYLYLLRQYNWIKEGKRRNANPEMVEQIRNFSERDTAAVLDYVSRLRPPPDMLAAKGWQNPDFR